jgi:hypothetical protein
MCTVSWVHRAGAYQLLCNRDEKRTRKPAHAPREFVREGVRCLAPVDGEAGGTWLSANERGVTLCLLNGAPAARPGTESRGLLVARLAGTRSAREGVARAQSEDLLRYAGFTLLALDPSGAAALVWDGRRAHPMEPAAPLISSSHDPEAVGFRRLNEFAELTAGRSLTAAVLFEFHLSHGGRPRGGADSPCMHRGDAETVSFSCVSVTPDAVEFFYTPAAPCRCAPGVTERLARRP